MKSIISIVRPNLRSLKPYTSARSIKTHGSIYLDANENPKPLFSSVFQQLNRYPQPQPKKIVEWASRIYKIKSQCLVVTRGTDEGIDLLTRAVCREARDRVLICPPTYGVYEIAAKIQGCKVVAVPTKGEDFSLDVMSLKKALRNQKLNIKIVYICTPNNPTGTLVPTESIVNLCKLANGRALVVVDEAYIEFSKTAGISQYIGKIPNLVVLRTLSKAWGLAGARCGFVFADATLCDVLQRIRAPYPMSAPTIQAVEEVFNQKGYRAMTKAVNELIGQRNKLQKMLQNSPFVERIFPSSANFLLVKVNHKDKILKAARTRGVVLRDRSADLGLNNCLRISIGTVRENLLLASCFKKEEMP